MPHHAIDVDVDVLDVDLAVRDPIHLAPDGFALARGDGAPVLFEIGGILLAMDAGVLV